MSADVEVRPYDPSMSDAALALERRCPQGKRFRLTFERPYFHRRAELYAAWKIFTAWSGDLLIGTAAVALKDAVLSGDPKTAAFCFDLRVDPDFRGVGVGGLLAQTVRDFADDNADFAYVYASADNSGARSLFAELDAEPAGGYRYLVLPTSPRRVSASALIPRAFEDVHSELLRTSGPFDFYCYPTHGTVSGYRGSWIAETGRERSGCSAWSTAEIMAEVVVKMPWHLSLIAAMPPGVSRAVGVPQTPRVGMRLRSWYLFDYFSTDALSGAKLVNAVCRAAADAGIDLLYLVHAPTDPSIAAVRAGFPRVFTPVLDYSLSLRPAPDRPVRNPYVDVRDV